MTRQVSIEAVLNSLVGENTVVAALLATGDADVIAVSPKGTDPEGARATAEWAAEQFEHTAGLRRQVGEEEFSLLFDPKDGDARLHWHLYTVERHVLLVLFKDRDLLVRVRQVSRTAAAQLAPLLVES